MPELKKWAYEGHVLRFGKPYAITKRVVTTAPTVAKARANILFKLKTQYCLARDAQLSLYQDPWTI